jgi:hypothetical protein
MRSFATVLLYVLAADTHSVQFLDELEAFLHPPQARLLGVDRRGVPTPIGGAKLLIHLALEGSLLDAYSHKLGSRRS